MRISDPQIGDSPIDPNMVRVVASLTYDSGESESLWFDVPRFLEEHLSLSMDPWVAATLPLAAKLGEDLEVQGDIDAYFFASLRELLEWWRFWFPEFEVIDVRPKRIVEKAPGRDSRVAQFFSGGVDSFFTLLRHSRASDVLVVDDLLIGWGFDIPINDASSFDRVRASIAHVADETGRRLVPFTTNFRETRLRELPWGEVGHGNAMAAVALLLQGAYKRVLIPSTDGYRENGPWGSHATTDHLYSSSEMRIVHEGAAFTRFQKVELVAQSEVAIEVLRVCWRQQSDENCGKCEKCLRTMIALELCGVLSRAGTFDHAELNLDSVARIYCPHTETGPFDLYYEEMRDASISRGRHDLARAISRSLMRSRLKQPILNLTRRLSWNRYVGPVAKPLDSALRRTIID